MFYNLFRYGIIEWIFKNISAINGGVGWVREYERKGGIVASLDVCTMGGYQILAILAICYLYETTARPSPYFEISVMARCLM